MIWFAPKATIESSRARSMCWPMPVRSRCAMAAAMARLAYIPARMSVTAMPTFCGPPPGSPSRSPVMLMRPPHALKDEIVARPVRARARLAEPGDRAIDDARIDLAQVFVGEPVFCEAADLVVLDQHVALRRELARDPLALGLRDVEGHRLLAAVHRKKVRRFARLPAVLVLEEGRAPAARVVARPGTLDLENFRAEVGEILRRPRPGENAREIENADVRERARHGGSGRGPADYIGVRREPG